MKQQQRKNIESGFNELIKRLESRREELIHDFSKRYEEEDQRIKKKREVLSKNKEDIETVKTIYEEIVQFIGSNSDAAALSKIQDITSFVSKSIEDLEAIAKSKGFDKKRSTSKRACGHSACTCRRPLRSSLNSRWCRVHNDELQGRAEARKCTDNSDILNL